MENLKTHHSLFAARVILSRALLLGLLIFCSRSGLAAPVTAAQAAAVVRGWLKADASPLGESMANAPVQGVEAFNDKTGGVIYYVVSLKPAGFVIVPGDDLVEPIIAFSSQDTFDPSEGNPLVALINGDIPGRLAAARDPAALALDVDLITAQDKWKQFEQLDANPVEIPKGLSSISDVRVAPLVATHWAQGNASGACYNYYTPPNGAGSSGNYICGCVATAFAQLVRYHQYPSTGVGTASFTIYVDGSSTTRSLRGGDGAGGPYNWSSMPTTCGSSTTAAQRQAIGALTADCGVSVNMEYTATASGAYTYKIKDRLVNTFHYSNAIKGRNGGSSNIGAGLNGMINPNLDARYPIVLGIDGTPGGHCIVCDGYGYNSSTLYHHLNMGWSGTSDAWYALPLVDNTYYGTFTSVVDCIYNVYETGTGEIISGRVLYSGAPAAGATVTATRTGGGTYTATTDANGVYALAKLPSASTYSTTVSKPGYLPATSTFSTGTSADLSASSGNVWGANFTLVANALPVVLSAGRELWDGSEVVVAYSVPVSPATATNINNYSINNGVTVTGASLGATSDLVVLSTDGLTNGSVCLLSVQNVQNLGGNTIVPVQVSIGTYPNVALWLKADAGVATNGSGLASAWTDQSGNGNNASPANLSAAPLYVANAFGTLPGLRFDGTSQYLVAPNSPSLAIAGDLTIYVVATINVTSWASVTNEISFVGKTAGPLGNMPAPYDYYLLHGTGLPRFLRGDGTSYGYTTGTTTPSVGAAHVFSVVMGGNNVVHYLDTQMNGTGAITTSIADAGTDLGIGSRHDLGPKMKGDMAEIIICSSALSDVDRASIDSYLGAKYAISPGSTTARYFYGSSGCSGGGGGGLWDETTANWQATDSGTCPGNTAFVAGDDAIFGGAAGSVTIPTAVGNPLTVNRIQVNTGGYKFAISLSSGQFRTSITTGRFTVNSGVTTINQQSSSKWTLFGAPGGTLYVDGAGTLDFADAATGVWPDVLKEYVTGGGTLVISSSGPEPSTPTSFLADYYKLDNGSTLYFAAYSPTYGANLGLTLGPAGVGGGSIQVDSGRTVTFGAQVTGAGGLTQAGAGTLVLSANNSSAFSGPVTVNGGTLNASVAGSLGSGNANVVSGVLKLSSATAMNSSASLTLPGSPAAGSVNLNFTGSQSVAALYFGLTSKAAGTWGAIGSTATHTNAAFIGVGILNVTTGQATTTVLTGTGSPTNYGASVTFTATVIGSSPVGTVQFRDGGGNLGSPVALSGGQAQLGTSTLSSGSHSITAVYSGDDNNGGNTSSALSQTVNQAPLTITANNDSKTYGQTRTYGTGSTAFTSSGLRNGETIGTVTITASGGTAANSAAGTYNLTPGAVTGGTFNPANYALSYQNGTLTVAPASSATTLISSLSPSGPGTNVTFTATVSSAGGMPTGNVVFSANAVPFSTNTLVSGSISASTASLPLGTNTVVAQYAAQGNYLASSAVLQQVVTNSVTGSPTNAVVGIAANPDGSFTLTFQGTPQARYCVVASPDMKADMNTWTPLCGSTNMAPSPTGQWSFIVSNAAPQYYRSKTVTP